MPIEGPIHNMSHLVKPPTCAAEPALAACFTTGHGLGEAQFHLWFHGSSDFLPGILTTEVGQRLSNQKRIFSLYIEQSPHGARTTTWGECKLLIRNRAETCCSLPNALP